MDHFVARTLACNTSFPDQQSRPAIGTHCPVNRVTAPGPQTFRKSEQDSFGTSATRGSATVLTCLGFSKTFYPE